MGGQRSASSSSRGLGNCISPVSATGSRAGSLTTVVRPQQARPVDRSSRRSSRVWLLLLNSSRKESRQVEGGKRCCWKWGDMHTRGGDEKAKNRGGIIQQRGGGKRAGGKKKGGGKLTHSLRPTPPRSTPGAGEGGGERTCAPEFAPQKKSDSSWYDHQLVGDE
jgi:hypothetical protein